MNLKSSTLIAVLNHKNKNDTFYHHKEDGIYEDKQGNTQPPGRICTVNDLFAQYGGYCASITRVHD
jgi:Xaa-Pro aminopeptidase